LWVTFAVSENISVHGYEFPVFTFGATVFSILYHASRKASYSYCIIQANNCDCNLHLTHRRDSFGHGDQINCGNLQVVEFNEQENNNCTLNKIPVNKHDDIDPD
jgi:hypothetical protein